MLVGRAVTGVMVPQRPDLHDTLHNLWTERRGRVGFLILGLSDINQVTSW